MKRYRKHLAVMGGVVLLSSLFLTSMVRSHCEIPCGIYGDSMRIDMMFEHTQTIEKSMNQMNKLSEEKDKNYNQLIRWTINKENHADKLSDIVTQYFMKQRIKPAEKGEGYAYDEYVKKLTLLHKLMVYSMKCKQTTDVKNVSMLRETLTQFKKAYMGEEDSSHSHSHSHSHPHTH